MSIRITFDNNVLDKYEGLPQDQRQSLSNSLKSHYISLYPSPEFIEEMLSIIESKRAELLSPRAAWLLEVLSGRPLCYHGEIIISELSGERNLFLEAGTSRRLHEVLKSISNGYWPTEFDELGQQLRNKKARYVADYKVEQDRFRAHFGYGKIDAGPKTLEVFEEKYWDEWRQQLVEDICRKSRIPHPESRSKEILNHVIDFPYLNVFLKVQAVMYYWYFVLNRKIEAGDLYDAGQLVYMAGLDWMVTEEKKLHEIFGMVFSAPKRIMTFDQFTNAIERRNERSGVTSPR